MPGFVDADPPGEVGPLSDWEAKYAAMPHSPLLDAGSTGEISFSAPTTPYTALLMFNQAKFSYFAPDNWDEMSVASSIPEDDRSHSSDGGGGSGGNGGGGGLGWGDMPWGSSPWGGSTTGGGGGTATAYPDGTWGGGTWGGGTWGDTPTTYTAAVGFGGSGDLAADTQWSDGSTGSATLRLTGSGGLSTTDIGNPNVVGSNLRVIGSGTLSAVGSTTKPAGPSLMRGIASAGGEFGLSSTSLAAFGGDPAAQYGSSWHFDSQASFNYLASKGVKLIRLPIAWEHVQPTLLAPLNTNAFAYVTAALDRIAAAGMKAIVDLHNYGQYATPESGYQDQKLGQGVITDAHLIDLWTRIATALKNHPAVLGYGLMNEPHDLYDTTLTFQQRATLWRTCTNNIVQAIRGTGDTHVITVMEMAIYSVSNWATWNPNKWINDPLSDREKIWYEQHIYEDYNRGGHYPNSYATELSLAQSAGYATILDRAMAWLQPWLDWLTANNVRGFIGEYGVPCDTDAASWATEAGKMLNVFDANKLHFTWWSAGEWFHQYTLAPYVQPLSNSGAISVARPPMSTTLEAYYARP